MPITPELLDELLKDYKSPDEMFGDDGLLQQLTKAVVERALQGEMTHHLGYEKHDPAGKNSGNSRNGKSAKTIKGKRGQLHIDVPRDRNSEFEPQLIRKGQTRFDGFDEKIISMYARGMTCREIKAHLQEIYGVEVSPDLISTVTDGVIDEVRAWQSRPLDAIYPILYLDALQVKVKDQGRVSNKAIYLAVGVNMQGLKEVLGLWASENEGAKFWLSIITELKARGVRDVFIACVDGLKGFPEAIEAIYPKTQVQLCLVHLMRFSLCYVSFKDRKEVAAGLKAVYRAASAEEAEQQL
jgi:putative transposase